VDSTQWDARYAGSAYEWTTKANQFVAAELADLAPGHALDLAAGEGRNSVWLAERGWQVTAVDFSSVGLEKGRRLADYHSVEVEWVVADLLDYQPPARTFDLVLIAYLHLPPSEFRVILERAVTALAPGGTLFVVGHDVDNLRHGIGGPQDAGILYSPEGLADAVDGLKVLRAERVHRTVGESSVAIDTLVRATALFAGLAVDR
jgi:SAM-dependent methyltransferase